MSHNDRSRRQDAAGRERPVFKGTAKEQARFLIFVAFLLLCVLGGGASRPDVASLLYLRPAAVLCIATLLVLAPGVDFRPLRWPLALLGAFAALMAIQLIPLPPGVWSALPMREPYLEAAAAAGLEQPWRPLSLAPDLTVNSLITLLFPLAGLIGFASLRRDQRRWLVPFLLAIVCASALLGIVQISGRPNGPAFLYDVTHQGMSVGFFSNRNHQAVLLAMALPLLRVWTLLPTDNLQYRRTRTWVALCLGLAIIPLVMVTGSRAGLVLTVAGLLFAFLLSPTLPQLAALEGRRGLRSLLLVLAPVAVAALVFFLGRATAVQRLLALETLETEPRVVFAPLTFEMAKNFFPFGTGFGAFDRVFRGYEPDATLDFAYFNHAHNDLVEIVIDGGLPALVLLLVFALWWGRRTYLAVRRSDGRPVEALCARLGAALMFMFFASSLVEYPLRVPLMSVIFAIACGWLAQTSAASERSRVS